MSRDRQLVVSERSPALAHVGEKVNASVHVGVGFPGCCGHAGSLKVLVMRALKLAPDQYALADVAQGRVSRSDARKIAEDALFERLMFLNR